MEKGKRAPADYYFEHRDLNYSPAPLFSHSAHLLDPSIREDFLPLKQIGQPHPDPQRRLRKPLICTQSHQHLIRSKRKEFNR